MKSVGWALLAALIGSAITVHGQTDSVVCGGSDRWPVKTTADTSKATIDAAAASTPRTVDQMLSQPRPTWQPPKSRYQNQAIPGAEGTTVRVRGWLYLIGHDPNDSDYHLQLAADLNNCTGKSVIVEVPDDRCVKEASLVPLVHTARNELDILLGHQPTLQGGEPPKKATEVIVTGRLFYDLHHERADGTPEPRGHGNCKAGTLWEIHPVMAVEIPPTGANSAAVSVADSRKKRRQSLGSTSVRPTRPRSSHGKSG